MEDPSGTGTGTGAVAWLGLGEPRSWEQPAYVHSATAKETLRLRSEVLCSCLLPIPPEGPGGCCLADHHRAITMYPKKKNVEPFIAHILPKYSVLSSPRVEPSKAPYLGFHAWEPRTLRHIPVPALPICTLGKVPTFEYCPPQGAGQQQEE